MFSKRSFHFWSSIYILQPFKKPSLGTSPEIIDLVLRRPMNKSLEIDVITSANIYVNNNFVA